MIRSAILPLPYSEPLVADHGRLRLFSGSANIPLSLEVSRYLGIDLGRWFVSDSLMEKFTSRFKSPFEAVMFI